MKKCLKSVLAALAGGMLVASCATTHIDADAVVVDDIENRVYQHPLVAEMEAMPRAELTLDKKQLKGVVDPRAYAVAELVKQHNADMLMEERLTVARKKGRIVSITVSGRPALYGKYHSVTQEDMDLFINPKPEDRCQCDPCKPCCKEKCDCQTIFCPCCKHRQPRFCDFVVEKPLHELTSSNETAQPGKGVGEPKPKREKPVFVPNTRVELNLIAAMGGGASLGVTRNIKKGFAWDIFKLQYLGIAEGDWEGFCEMGYEDTCHQFSLTTGPRFTTPRSRKGQGAFFSVDFGLAYSRVGIEKSANNSGYWGTSAGKSQWYNGTGSHYYDTVENKCSFGLDLTFGIFLAKRFYLAYQYGLVAGGVTAGAHWGKLGIAF